jgi:two-component system, cell cycle response regulator
MKPKLLIVDDNKTERLAVVDALKAFECETFEAEDGPEGLAKIKQEKPDVVLLDFTMPGLDGSEVMAKIQADPGLRQIPVIMLTSQASRPMVMKVARLGVRDYLVKPCAPDTLIEHVSRVVPLKPMGEVAAPKRYEDPLILLIIDDKTVIHDQIKQQLSDTPWQAEARALVSEAMEFIEQNLPDAILVSLNLPGEDAYALQKKLRAQPRTRKIPLFGMSVKTARQEQTKALDQGFAGIISKPIQAEALKAQLCRGLNLDTSGKYFEQQEGALILRIPEAAPAEVAGEILNYFPAKLAQAVEAGLDKVLLDLTQPKAPTPGLVALLSNSIRQCADLNLDYRVVASEAVAAECRKQDEAKTWHFADSVDEVMMQWASPSPMSA